MTVVLASDEIDSIRVITFYAHAEYETRVEIPHGVSDLLMDRYDTAAQAMVGHRKALNRLESWLNYGQRHEEFRGGT